jgi:hypothetical protein
MTVMPDRQPTPTDDRQPYDWRVVQSRGGMDNVSWQAPHDSPAAEQSFAYSIWEMHRDVAPANLTTSLERRALPTPVPWEVVASSDPDHHAACAIADVPLSAQQIARVAQVLAADAPFMAWMTQAHLDARNATQTVQQDIAAFLTAHLNEPGEQPA